MKPSAPGEEIEAELRRAEKSLRAARLLFQEGLLEDALSRTYYAVLHAARAALLTEGIRVKSHKSVRRLFGQHLIKTGRLDSQYAAILAEEQDDRYLADYDAIFSPEKEQVNTRVKDATRFLKAIKRYLSERQKRS
ncbi:MAG: HEPN domain-containing protein [Nitrospinae bacterium]|nr:HEPN domain-containing protein [Nitrospinota bacterium]